MAPFHQSLPALKFDLGRSGKTRDSEIVGGGANAGMDEASSSSVSFESLPADLPRRMAQELHPSESSEGEGI